MKGLLPFVLIFANFVFFCISDFFPDVITYKQFAMVLAIVSVVIVICDFKKLLNLKQNLFFLIITFLVICIGFLITSELLYSQQMYGNDIFHGEFLAFIGQTIPIVLIAAIFAQKEQLLAKTKLLTPYVALLFTLISTISALFPSNVTSGGYALDENGMNYQNISYMAAFAASFSLFYLLNQNKMSFGKLFNNKIIIFIMALLIFVNFFTILIAGGRGALVTIIIQLSVFIVVRVSLSNNRGRTLLRLIPIIIITVLVGFYVVSLVNNLHIETSGYGRILSFLNEREDVSRHDINRIAFESIKESPIFGHGIGSSIFVIGNGTEGQHIHCHNLFTGAMVETGIIGTVFLLIVMIKTFRRIIFLMKKDMTNYLWMVILLDGFVMSVFSGYYLVHLPIAWSIGFALSKAKVPTNKDKALHLHIIMQLHRLNENSRHF